jgi:hypothetical protein
MRRPIRAAALAALVVAATGPAAASGATSHTPNWSTEGGKVDCGIANVVEPRIDPGTGAPLEELGRGLECSALGIPHPKHGIGDPFVKVGQGPSGRAQLVDESQDELIFNKPFVTLAPGSTWRKAGIVCSVQAASVHCRNRAGHGFTISPGHVHLF